MATSGGPPGALLYSHAASGKPRHPQPDATICRTYAQIIQDEKSNRNILEIKLRKITKEADGVTVKPRNLTQEDISELFFDTLKIEPKDCLGIAIFTNRYDCKEIKLRPGVDTTKYVTTNPIIFKDHEIQVKKQLANVTRITFRNVPFSIPDEELLHLCSTYGEIVDNKVIYEKPTYATRGVCGATRFVNVRMKRGMQMENFYFLQGPLEGDRLVRVTVLHPGQMQQCSNCLRRAPNCPGGGNGKLCEEANTPRGSIQAYMEHLRSEFDYVSLATQYKEFEFPSLNGKSQSKNNPFVEDDEDEEEEEEEEIFGETENLKQKLNEAEIKIANLNESKQQASDENSSLQRELANRRSKLQKTLENQAKMDATPANPSANLNETGANAEQHPVVMVEASPKQFVDISDPSATFQEGEQDPLKTNDQPLNNGKETETTLEVEKAKETPEKIENTVEAEEAKNETGKDCIMKIKINKRTTVHMRKGNFSYNRETDTLEIIDEKEFTQEIQIKCNAKVDRESKIMEMKGKALEKIKDEFRNEQRERSNSTVRRRSEEENDENKPSKALRKSSSTSKMPSPPKSLGILGSIKSTLKGQEPTMASFLKAQEPTNASFRTTKSSIPAPSKPKI